MTDKEFRRLSRADLVEIIYQLQQSEKTLQKENQELKQKLEDRQVAISESGSLAEVMAKLNGLFEAAQATADDYRKEAEQLLEEARSTREQADNYQAEIRQQASKLAHHTMQQRKEILAKTEKECQQLREAARKGRRIQQRSRENLNRDDDHPVEEEQYHGVSEG